MIEMEHKPGLWSPPEGTTAVVVPCSAEVGQNATMGKGFALQAKKYWPSIARNVGAQFLGIGVIAHSVTRPYITQAQPDGYIGMPVGGGQAGAPVPYHIISLPIRTWEDAPIDDNYLTRAVRTLAQLCEGRREEIWWLTKGLIVMPQLNDYVAKPKRAWANLTPLVEPWLADDRYVILTNRSTPT